MKICTPLYVSFDSVSMCWLRKAPLILVVKIFVCLFVCFFVTVLQVAIFAGVFLSLAGALFGFWTVRKLVLTEDGSIDMSTSVFVSWSIRIIAAVLILQVIFTVRFLFKSNRKSSFDNNNLLFPELCRSFACWRSTDICNYYIIEFKEDQQIEVHTTLI